ncbi:MAG: flagellar hook capping FlgD N-terminal domain-containing protein [Verrucomicrobiota bacterium]
MTDPINTSSIFQSDQVSSPQSQELTQEDFYQILVTQISNQDPLKPVDSNAFMEDFMTMANFDAIQEMGNQFGSLYEQQQYMWASDLVGSEVTLRNENGQEISGAITSSRVGNDKVYITVDDQEYEASSIESIIKT